MSKLSRENIELRSKIIVKTEFIGSSAVIIKLKSEIEKLSPFMIKGSVSNGKE